MTSAQIYKRRIASTSSLQKIFNAQELIAASRITKSRNFAKAAEPYTTTLAKAVAALTSHSNVKHPITTGKTIPEGKKPCTAILVLSADRGMAGAYSVSVIREAMRLSESCQKQGKDTTFFVFGRRGVNWFNFRSISLGGTWEGHSDAPSPELAGEITDKIISSYLDPNSTINEVIIVYTKFKNMVSQEVRNLRMLPIEVEEKEVDSHDIPPLYEFEPSEKDVLDAILPRYFRSRVHHCLLEAAASETASRRRAMHTATENSKELIEYLTTKANQARQATITNELSEIVGSANALEDTKE